MAGKVGAPYGNKNARKGGGSSLGKAFAIARAKQAHSQKYGSGARAKTTVNYALIAAKKR